MNMLKNPPSGDKSVQRKYFAEKRRVLSSHPERKADLDSEIQSRLVLTREFREADVVLLYISQPREIATDMILSAALINGKLAAAPRCGEEGEMTFFAIGGKRDLKPGRFGIMEPAEYCEPVELSERTLCVCPALACDMSGRRLGYGGGYYDRFLKDFPGVSVALCYTDAVVPALPREEHDVPVEMIVTDSYVKQITDIR